jgi:hypothetical protein
MGIHLRSAKQIFTARKNENDTKERRDDAAAQAKSNNFKCPIVGARKTMRKRERERAALSNFNNPTSAQNE